MIYSLGSKKPVPGKNCFIAENATLVGEVHLADNVSIWFNAVLRADSSPITIGENSNIQDGTVCHGEKDHPLTVGKNVTVGHKAMIHGCTIGDNCIIGINSVVMNGAVIGDNCIIGSGALVTEGKIIPPGSLVLGAPGKVVKEVSDAQREMIADSARHYVENGLRYNKELQKK